MRQVNEAAFWFAMEVGCVQTYEDLPMNLAYYDDLRIGDKCLIEEASGLAYALGTTWRHGRPHRMLPSEMMKSVCQFPMEHVAMERTFDFEYNRGEFEESVRKKEEFKSAERKGYQVVKGWPEDSDVEAICGDVTQWSAEVGNDDYSTAPVLGVVRLGAKAYAQGAPLRPYTLVQGGCPVGLQLVWAVAVTGYTVIRITTRAAREATRLLLGETARLEGQYGTAWINDGPGFPDKGLVWFKSSLAKCRARTYIMCVDVPPERLAP